MRAREREGEREKRDRRLIDFPFTGSLLKCVQWLVKARSLQFHLNLVMYVEGAWMILPSSAAFQGALLGS